MQTVRFQRPPGFAVEPLTVNKMKRIVRLLRPKPIGEGLVARIRREQHEITRESRRILNRASAPPRTYGDISGKVSTYFVNRALRQIRAERMKPVTKTITINIVEISNGWLVSTPGTYSESDETSLYEDRQQPVTFYPDYDCVVAAMPDIARTALKHEEDAETRRRNAYERDRSMYEAAKATDHARAYPGEPIVEEQVVDQTDQMEPVPEEATEE